MFKALGRFVVGHRWLVIIGWLIAGAAVIGYAPSLATTSDQAEFLPKHYESIQAKKIQEKAFPKGFSPRRSWCSRARTARPWTRPTRPRSRRSARPLQAKKYEKVEQVITSAAVTAQERADGDGVDGRREGGRQEPAARGRATCGTTSRQWSPTRD